MSVPEVGPKTAKTLYDTLRIKNLSELEKAAATHRIRYLPHFGEKTEENILKGIRLVKSGG